MERKRPQLKPEDLSRLRWALGALLAWLSVLTAWGMDASAGLLMPVVALAAGATLVRPDWPARVPRLAHRLAFPFILLFFVYDLLSSAEPLPALVRLALLLILYRVVTYRQRRDDLQLVLLGLFLIIVAGVITVSLFFVVQLLGFTACALIMLLAVTLEHADGRAPEAPQPGVVPGWARGTWRAHGTRLRAAIDWRLAGLGVAAYAVMVVVSGMLFLAIPRFEISNSLFLDRLISRSTKTGFSEDIRFGEVTSIAEDNSLAFAVDVTDLQALPAVPYWRMVVLDEYTGEGFRISSTYRRDLNLVNTARMRINGTRLRPDYNAPIWTIYMEPGISRYLPLLGDFYTMAFTEPQMFGFHEQLRVVALRDEPVKMFAYQTWNMGTEAELLDAQLGLSLAQQSRLVEPFLRLPDDPTMKSRLEDVLARFDGLGQPNVEDWGAAAITWLESVHPYAMDSVVPTGDGDVLLRWLDSETPGHCELFAGSMVLLARAAGIPARVVTGFRGGTWNDFSGSFMVRNAQAHAWVELFDTQRSVWVRFDPTPGNQALADRAEAEQLTSAAIARDGSWNARMESLRVFWYRRIVSFDLDTQEALLSSTKSFFRERSDALKAWAENRAIALREWISRPWDRKRWLSIAIALAAGVAAGWLLLRYGAAWWLALQRGIARGRGRATQHDPVRREAARWLQRGRKRTEFHWPDELEGALLRLRFGKAETWPEPSDVFRAARRTLRTAR